MISKPWPCTLLLIGIFCSVEVHGESVELKVVNRRDDFYEVELKTTGQVIATVRPCGSQGNIRIFDTVGRHCGVSWPHFLMNSEGKWLTDKVESEGLNLRSFEILKPSGKVIAWRGEWRFRDLLTTSERHCVWYDDKSQSQVHCIRTELTMLESAREISSTWVEFMTPENSYTTVAAKTRGGRVITLDISTTGENRNMHYWDGEELDDQGWITIYGAASGQRGCVAMVPLKSSERVTRPRINNGHVDNIEIHLLDPRARHHLTERRTFRLDYLLISCPDRNDWRWIDSAAHQADAFIQRSESVQQALHVECKNSVIDKSNVDRGQ